MTYEETLTYLFERLPMFTRLGAAAYKKDITNTIALCDVLGNPQQHFKSVHIAGTNGKGSTSHMLASILQSAGYQTGLYTSPHLKDFRERIRINGEKIPESYITQFVVRYKDKFEQIEPSFFEWTVALCFDYFAHQKIDVAIVETGLGGRLDSTNIITPLLSVITNIGWDHTDLLGDTLEKIAAEKAGIIKPTIPVVIGEIQASTYTVFEQKAKLEQAPFIVAPNEFSVHQFNTTPSGGAICDVYKDQKPYLEHLELQLGGLYQQENIVTVLAAVQQLREQGFQITETDLRHGLKHTVTQTGLWGRWQVLSESPLTICDTGHNEAGIARVVKQLQSHSNHRLHIVFGVVKDKDISKVLHLLPRDATYYFCHANLPRALPAIELQQQAKDIGIHGMAYNSVKEAYIAAQENATPHDLIFIGGSTFVVAEII